MTVHKPAISSHWIFFEFIQSDVRDHDEQSNRFICMEEKERKGQNPSSH